MKTVFVVAALLAATLFGEALGAEKVTKAITLDISNFIDRATPYLSKFIIDQKIDPMALPDQDKSIWIPHPITIVWKAKLGLRSGTLHALSALHRQGSVSVHYNEKVLAVKLVVGFDKLMALYDYFVDLTYHRIDGHALISPKFVDVGIKLQFDGNKYRFNLDTFKVLHVENIDVDFKGNLLIDWATGPLTSFVMDIFQDLIVWAIESSAKTTIQDYLNDLGNQIRPQSQKVGPVFSH